MVRVAALVPVVLLMLFTGRLWLAGLVCGRERHVRSRISAGKPGSDRRICCTVRRLLRHRQQHI